MELRTYRATSMQEAIAMVRRDLGPDAAVLDSREVSDRRCFGLLPGRRKIEITASCGVDVPSRLPAKIRREAEPVEVEPAIAIHNAATTAKSAEGTTITQQMQGQLSTLRTMVNDLCRQTHGDGRTDWSEPYCCLYKDLLDAEITADIARELVERLRTEPQADGVLDPVMLKSLAADLLEEDLRVAGPIQLTPGRCRLVAMVGPTGVGKTTTVAKLAANFRLKEKRRVGLITVDTYRIAAVEQLRTYADIIDLPLHVVSTPRDMRETVERLSHLDLILLDTAGCNPKDDVRMKELQTFLGEAKADEVHLVLSSLASPRTLELTAKEFSAIGATSFLFTKIDEARSLGNLTPALHGNDMPVSYLTDGQNVPNDIAVADAHRLSRLMVN